MNRNGVPFQSAFIIEFLVAIIASERSAGMDE